MMKNGSQIMFRFIAIPALLAVLVSAGQVHVYGAVINEFLETNDSGIVDDYGDHSDWIELYNPDPVPFDIGGYYLTDNLADLTKWLFPAVMIPPEGYLLVFASGRDQVDPGNRLHTNFKLKSSGEYLGLVHPDGMTIVHGFFYPEDQTPNVSYGMFPDGAPSQQYMPPSPEAWNVPEPATLTLLTLVGLAILRRRRIRCK